MCTYCTSVHNNLCREQAVREHVNKEQSCNGHAGVGNKGSENR